MSNSNKILPLVLGVRLKGLVRQIFSEWPTYFVLGPVMIGVAYLLARRILTDFTPQLEQLQAPSISEGILLQVGLTALFLKIFFNFIPLAARLYPTERSLGVDDFLPIRSETRYWIFYFDQLLRDLPLFVISILVLIFFQKGDYSGWPLMIWFLFPAVQIGFTIGWIHLRPPDRVELFGALLLFIWLIWFLQPGALEWALDFFAPLMVVVGYRGVVRWRYGDVARVERLLLQSASTGTIPGILGALVPRRERPLVLRDLLLTFRGFVPIFWRNLILALLFVAATAIRGAVSPFLFCGGASFIIAAAASNLFAAQRPFRWFDFSLPLAPEAHWRAKVAYASLLSLPIPFLVWGIEAALHPLPFGEALFLFVRLFCVAQAVALVTGGSVCEGDQKPFLHYVIAAFLSALAAFLIGALHPLFILLVFPLLSYFERSAGARLGTEGGVA